MFNYLFNSQQFFEYFFLFCQTLFKTKKKKNNFETHSLDTPVLKPMSIKLIKKVTMAFE